jgi:ecotin
MKKSNTLFTAILIAFLASLSINMDAQKKSLKTKQVNNQKMEKIDVSMFPAAKPGFKRSMIQVPAQGDDMNFKIEFFVGKDMEVDCNHHSMMGKIEEKDLQGWGYNYYEVDSKDETMSTLMACLDGKKTKKFVTTPSVLTRYNSRLPIVIYHPENLEVRYRIWSADSNIKKATN